MEMVRLTTVYYGTHYQSPLGDIFIASDEKSVIGLWIENQKYIANTMPEGIAEPDDIRDIPVLQECIKWLDDYFAGKKPEISRLLLAPIGGAFKQCVWQILRKSRMVN